MSIEFFQKKAKALLAAVRAGDPAAVTRARAVCRDVDGGFPLMKAQHVVSVEAGFHKWDALVSSSDVERRLVITLEKQPRLNDFGIGLYDGGRGLSPEERALKLAADRSVLRAKAAEVQWLVGWLKANVAPTKTLNTRRTPYGLKHVAEKFSPNKYLTKGVFIAAGIIAGYPYKVSDGSPNVYFAMSEASLNQISRGKVATSTDAKVPFVVGGPTNRRQAWRNMLVAAINEGHRRGIFTLQPGDRFSKSGTHHVGETYRFTFGDNVDAIARVEDIGWDELTVRVALWPTPRADRWVECTGAGFGAGEAWAEGWLERRDGCWLQEGGRNPLFSCRRERLPLVAATNVVADGYRDAGPFRA